MISDSLFKRNNTYYFRLYLPQDIAPYFSRREIWKSLKTKNYKTARTTISKLLYSTERLFLHLRSGMYTDTQMKQLVNDYLQAYLNRCESLRSIAMVRYEGDGQEQITASTDVQVIADTSVKAIDDHIASRKRKLMSNDFSDVNVRVGWFIKEKGLSIDVGSVEYNKFCREILKAEIQSLKIEKERVNGNYDNDYDNYLTSITAPIQLPITVPAVPLPPAEPVVLLSKVVEEHINEATMSGTWTEKTLRENSSIYKVMMELIGDRDIRSIDNQMMLDFRGKLVKLPANREKVARYRGKTIEQILAMKSVVPLSKTTVNKYLIRIGSLFKWAAKKKFIMVNYAEGLSLSKKTSAYEERETYSKEDIQRLFTNLKLNQKEPQEYWIPLIALYEGMRLEEACQLHMA